MPRVSFAASATKTSFAVSAKNINKHGSAVQYGIVKDTPDHRIRYARAIKSCLYQKKSKKILQNTLDVKNIYIASANMYYCLLKLLLVIAYTKCHHNSKNLLTGS